MRRSLPAVVLAVLATTTPGAVAAQLPAGGRQHGSSVDPVGPSRAHLLPEPSVAHPRR